MNKMFYPFWFRHKKPKKTIIIMNKSQVTLTKKRTLYSFVDKQYCYFYWLKYNKLQINKTFVGFIYRFQALLPEYFPMKPILLNFKAFIFSKLLFDIPEISKIVILQIGLQIFMSTNENLSLTLMKSHLMTPTLQNSICKNGELRLHEQNRSCVDDLKLEFIK